ncbi:MAG TPA: hypothetical protein VGS19_37275 [Streptosporangiaceae bacterium]|nr:hypothetical protein [Streptosporangiaceae bacterium]
MDDIEIAHGAPYASGQAVRRAGTWVTMYPPTAEFTNDMMCDLICPRATSMVEDKPTVAVKGKVGQDTAKSPALRRGEQ